MIPLAEVVTTAADVTPDQVGSTLDTLINVGASIDPASGTVIALILAALVFVRQLWKFYKNKKG